MELKNIAFIRLVLALPIAACIALMIISGDVLMRAVFAAGLVLVFFLHEALTISALESIKRLKPPRAPQKSSLLEPAVPLHAKSEQN